MPEKTAGSNVVEIPSEVEVKKMQEELKKKRALDCSQEINVLLKKFNCVIIPQVVIVHDSIKSSTVVVPNE